MTDSILEGDVTCSTSVKKVLREADYDNTWTEMAKQNSLRALSRDISWPKLWDMARDRGIGARSLSMIIRLLAHL